MVYKFPVLSFFTAMAAFFLSTLLSQLYHFEAATANFWLAMGLSYLFNPLSLSGTSYKLWGVSGLVLGTALAYLYPPAAGAWLFAAFLAGGFFLNRQAEAHQIGLLFVFGAVYFNLSFITNTSYEDVQYDFASCYNYIEYILDNDFMFWRENPLLSRPSYSSYHPILHFFLTALMLKGAGFIASREIALEAVQTGILFYMAWYYLIALKIIFCLKVKKSAELSAAAFVVFFPAYNAMAGFFNNDCLLLPLEAGVIYYSLLYEQEGGRKNLGLILLFATAAGLTKLSGLIVLPMTAAALGLRLYRQRDRRTFFELAVFGIFLAAGLSIWPLYQQIRLGVGADFVPPQEHLSLVSYSYAQRFAPLRGIFYHEMFYHDFGINLWETLTKTALFMQWDFSMRAKGWMFFVYGLALSYKVMLLCIAGGVIFCLFKQKKGRDMLFLTLVLWGGIIGGIVCFSLKHPFMCNQDFRYIAILALALGMFWAMFIDKVSLRFRAGFISVAAAFSFLSAFVWWLVSW